MDEMCKPPAALTPDDSSPTTNGKVIAGVPAKAQAPTEPEEELLGSVTMHNCPGTRASARVIQKMKQDQTRPMTPPPNERELAKKEEKAAQKTPSQVKSGNGKTTWTNVERNSFFDALNEFGKDFEAVGNCINAKLKRRNASSDYSFKTKDQVRQHYYQTYHKVCKYVRYSEELKKPAQELYTLINYGEMRRKLQFLTEKHFMKLKQLVYQGQITVRCKGKNIRIKTPSCKALRRLNQLDDSLEDIRLPSKVEVLVTPANMESFGRVQSLAQNPRGRIIVPLHKKLISFIKTFEYKWRSANQRLSEEKPAYFPSAAPPSSSNTSTNNINNNNNDPDSIPSLDPSICFQPKPGVPIHRPLLSITAYLSSVNICLTAYEERLGFKVRSETLGNLPGVTLPASKRPRTESGSEKRSPEAKKIKPGASPALEKSLDEGGPVEEGHVKLDNSSGDELGEEVLEFLSDGAEGALAFAPPSDTEAAEVAPPVMEIPTLNPNPPDLPDDLPICNPVSQIAAPIPASDPALAPAPLFATTPTSTPAPTDAPTTAPAPNSTPQAPPAAPPVVPSAQTAPPPAPPAPTTPLVPARAKRKEAKEAAAAAQARNFKPLLSDDILKRIRRGWTLANAADITIGDLYVVLGQDSKLELEYYFCEVESSAGHTPAIPATCSISSPATPATITSGQTGISTNMASTSGPGSNSLLPYNPNDCDSVERVKAVTSSTVGNRLKHLLLVANLSERVRRRQCTCGHTCDRKRDLMSKAQQLAEAAAASGTGIPGGAGGGVSGIILGGGAASEGNFRTPMLPVRRPIANIIDPVRQLTALTRQKISRQVLVQRRLLPPASFGGRPYDLLNVRQLHSGLFEPIDRLSSSSSSSGISSGSGSSLGSNPIQSLALTSITRGDREGNHQASLTEEAEEQALQFLEDGPNARDMPNLDFCVATSSASGKTSLPDVVHQDESTTQNFFHGSVSPMHLLRDSTSNARWLEENINDFSLTSLLGHLDEIDATRDILDPSSSMSVISESSVDFRHKFQEIAALLQQQEKD